MISSRVMEALRAIEAENCVLHNDIHVGNVILRDGSHSPVIIDFTSESLNSVMKSSRVSSGRLQTHVA